MLFSDLLWQPKKKRIRRRVCVGRESEREKVKKSRLRVICSEKERDQREAGSEKERKKERAGGGKPSEGGKQVNKEKLIDSFPSEAKIDFERN